MIGLRFRALTFVLLATTLSFADEPVPRNLGLWKLDELKRTPEATWGEAKDGVQEVYYAGEPLVGKPTRVFGYFAKPDGDGPFSAMVLVHGGGGKAFRDWAVHWSKRGYAALAMDLAGNGPNGRLIDGGPDQNDDTKFRHFTDVDARDMWTYHAVAAVIRGHSLLASRKEVDKDRIGITGISWGGYLTCIVAGLDDRLKVAVPVYGCGFLAESSVWEDRMAKMPAEERELWTKHFDPSQFVGGTSCPILFLNGTNDFAYPPDSYKKTYALPKSSVTIAMVPRLAHGHIWTFPIVDLFVDSVLANGVPLPKLGPMKVEGNTASAPASSDSKLVKFELHYTTDTGPWQKREWKSSGASLKDGQIVAQLPANLPLVCYLAATDERGAMVSTQHEIVEAPQYGEHQDLSYYLAAARHKVEIKTKEDWEVRRRHIVANVEKVMGKFKPEKPVQLAVQELESTDGGKFIRKKLSYCTDSADRRVHAYLFLPKEAKGPVPAVLCLHQTTSIGKSEPAGPPADCARR